MLVATARQGAVRTAISSRAPVRVRRRKRGTAIAIRAPLEDRPLGRTRTGTTLAFGSSLARGLRPALLRLQVLHPPAELLLDPLPFLPEALVQVLHAPLVV